MFFALILLAAIIWAVVHAVRWALRADRDELDSVIDHKTRRELSNLAQFMERFYRKPGEDA